jgi:adenine-specific DNA-methyltransferase
MKELKNPWGPQDPHPLSKIRTELVWEGKYDEYGNRREVEIAGSDMPLKRVEAIDEPRSSAEGSGQIDLFKKKSKRQDDFRNMLIWGDNKLVMASLLLDFRGKIDFIYVDPPFDVGADFTMDVPIGDGRDTFHKDQSVLEMVAYRDTWGKGTDSYLQMMYERLALMRELLSDKGAIYIHCDWRVSSLMRLLLDDIFGVANHRNDLRWRRQPVRGAKATSDQYARNSDTILFYSKSKEWTWNGAYKPYDEEFIKKKFRPDGKGRLFRDCDLGDYSEESIRSFEQKGRIYITSSGKKRLIRYLDEEKGESLGDIWIDIPEVNSMAEERTGYDTQKPEALIERMINASSSTDDIVADFFCGSGTTGAVAEKLGRRWIMCDLGRFGIHTTRKRMIETQRQLYGEQCVYRAFDVYNLGRYERQWWQKERLAGADEEHRNIVLAFYRAENMTDAASPVIHGRKGSAFVHVDSIDSILTLTDLKPIAEATQAAGAKEVHCLAWEFEMELKRNAEALEHEYGVKVRLIRIPREVMEKNRRPGVDSVPFFEMATLSAKPIINICTRYLFVS